MMKLKRSMGLFALVCLASSHLSWAVIGSVSSNLKRSRHVEPDDACSVPLVAAQHTVIGEFFIELVDSNKLMATDLITDGYSRLRETHLYIGAKTSHVNIDAPFSSASMLYGKSRINSFTHLGLWVCK